MLSITAAVGRHIQCECADGVGKSSARQLEVCDARWSRVCHGMELADKRIDPARLMRKTARVRSRERRDHTIELDVDPGSQQYSHECQGVVGRSSKLIGRSASSD